MVADLKRSSNRGLHQAQHQDIQIITAVDLELLEIIQRRHLLQHLLALNRKNDYQFQSEEFTVSLLFKSVMVYCILSVLIEEGYSYE